MPIERQPFWPRLTYASRQQALELIRLRRRVGLYNLILLTVVIIGIIASAFTYILNSNYLVSLSTIVMSSIIVIAIVEAVKNENSQLNKLREYTTKHVNSNFCMCNSSVCNCKEEFIIYMSENEHINLAY